MQDSRLSIINEKLSFHLNKSRTWNLEPRKIPKTEKIKNCHRKKSVINNLSKVFEFVYKIQKKKERTYVRTTEIHMENKKVKLILLYSIFL